MFSMPELTRVKSLNHRFLEGPTNLPTELPSELQLGFIRTAPLHLAGKDSPRNSGLRKSAKRAALGLRPDQLEPPYKRRTRLSYAGAPIGTHAVLHTQPAYFVDARRIRFSHQQPLLPSSPRNHEPCAADAANASIHEIPPPLNSAATHHLPKSLYSRIPSALGLSTLSKYTLKETHGNFLPCWYFRAEGSARPSQTPELLVTKQGAAGEPKHIRTEAVKLLGMLITKRQAFVEWLRNFRISIVATASQASSIRLFQSQLRSYTNAVFEIRGQLQKLFVQRIQPSCSAKALGQRQLSMSWKRVQAVASDLFVEQYRYKRELERILLLQESRKLTFESLLRPAIEPADVEVLAFRNPEARPLVGKRAFKVPTGISKILKDYELRVASARRRQLNYNTESGALRIPTTQRESLRLMLLYCSAVLGKTTEPAIAELGRVLADKEKLTRNNIEEPEYGVNGSRL